MEILRIMLQNWVNSTDIWKILEIAAVIFSIISVILTYFNKVSLYLFGILATAIYIFIFMHPSHKLYAEGGLNFYYFIMSIWGWWQWERGANKSVLKISSSNFQDFKITLSIALVSFVLILLILKNFTDSDVPYFDSSIAAFAWAATWLLTKRKLEYWIWINISNAIAIPLLFYKGLYPTVGLTIFQFIMAILGYLKWKKIINSTK